MLTGAGFGAALRAELAQSMRAARKPGLAAPPDEPTAKGVGRLRLPARRHQIHQVSDLFLCRVDAAAQRRQNGQFVGLDDPRTALLFAEHQFAVALHLRPEPDGVAAPHPSIEQEIERQPRLGANRMACLIARRIGLGPCRNSVGIVALQIRHIARRVLVGIAISRANTPTRRAAAMP